MRSAIEEQLNLIALGKVYICSVYVVCSELVLPTMRSAVEEQLNLFALGKVYICSVYMKKILRDIKSMGFAVSLLSAEF